MFSAGDFTVSPFSATRPASISFSASRREQMPARAITLAMRSPVFLSVVSFVICDLAKAMHSGSVRRMEEQDNHYMRLALAEALAAAERGEVPIGAVLTSSGGDVLSMTGNRIVELH